MDKNKLFLTGFLWLLLATIVSFLDEFIKESFENNQLITGLSSIIVLFIWLVFIYHVMKFLCKVSKG
ncbi:hypothetical protein AAGS61_07270 [Lysinibacillus sp. KU-BSD001]|uniref:hypothetical protein n=1 Tax=Lysinibacillus sp. KU-BSD001 TaxID=3141328 RepID=UPI0036EEB326